MIFIDTGAFLARWLTQDSQHQAALRVWETLEEVSLYTSNHVLDETLTLLARRASYGFAAERAELLFASENLEILYAAREDEERALPLFRKFADQQVTFTDCVSFVLMRRYRIPTAFTFDRHFRLAGWKVIP